MGSLDRYTYHEEWNNTAERWDTVSRENPDYVRPSAPNAGVNRSSADISYATELALISGLFSKIASTRSGKIFLAIFLPLFFVSLLIYGGGGLSHTASMAHSVISSHAATVHEAVPQAAAHMPQTAAQWHTFWAQAQAWCAAHPDSLWGHFVSAVIWVVHL